MFPTVGRTSRVGSEYGGINEEASVRGKKGILREALRKVHRQVHPSLLAQNEALEYIEELIMRLLAMLCASQPHSVEDVENRVDKSFPHPVDKWANSDAKNALEKCKKKCPLVLPVDKIQNMLFKEMLSYKVDHHTAVYIVAVLEYISADILKLTGNYVKNIKHQEITCQDIKVAMCADKVLMDMFFQDEDLPNVEVDHVIVRRGSPKYDDIVKDMVLESTQYIRDLDMIIHVFMKPISEMPNRLDAVQKIFGNIQDISEFSSRLLSSIEDCIEMNEDSSTPLIGTCFEDAAEGVEFDVFFEYSECVMNQKAVRESIESLLDKETVIELQKKNPDLVKAIKYVLPKLLVGPIFQCLYYVDVIKALIDTSPDSKDKESLKQAEGVLLLVKARVEDSLGPLIKKRGSSEFSLRFQGRGDRQAALAKINEFQKSIDGWEGKDIGQSCNEFIMEGSITKVTNRRHAERYMFLFDTMIVLTKQNTKRSSVTASSGEYKFKEKIHMRKVSVEDRDDATDMPYAFELQVNGVPMVLYCKTQEEKNDWMAALVKITTRTMLERALDTQLQELDNLHPLVLPDSSKYCFSEEDTEGNIQFEEQLENKTPLIKGGTIHKLVERLTYHTYADPKFVRTFLTTYRSFCEPLELMELLIQRFDIPEPFPTQADDEMEEDPVIKEQRKKFRREYCKPIQIRVLNVLRHWMDQHWYDFTNNKDLRARLEDFLESVKAKKMMIKYVESIQKIIKRRLDSDLNDKAVKYQYQKDFPPVEWHITRNPKEFELMSLHPIEIARQITLIEFDLYRAVKPSEMVGSAWTKSNRKQTSSNLLQMIHFSTTFTFWLEKCIIEAENFEERLSVVARIHEIMMVFQELNNFSGVIEVVSALQSAPVHRLKHTFEALDDRYHKYVKAFNEAKELLYDHYKAYIEKLRSINPPCVPFLGFYLTNILMTEEGNPDYLPNRPPGFINFSKRRKVAEITQEIQQYQNQLYCLRQQDEIRDFLLNLNPLEGMEEKQFCDLLYEKCLKIEPRDSRTFPKFEKMRTISLKSPGIKPTPSRQHPHPHSSRGAGGPQPTSLSHPNCDYDNTDSLSSPPNTPKTPPFDNTDVFIREDQNHHTNHQHQNHNQRESNPPMLRPTQRRISSQCADDPPPVPPRPHKSSSKQTRPYTSSRSHGRDSPPPRPPRLSHSNVPNLRRNSERDASHDAAIPLVPPPSKPIRLPDHTSVQTQPQQPSFCTPDDGHSDFPVFNCQPPVLGSKDTVVITESSTSILHNFQPYGGNSSSHNSPVHQNSNMGNPRAVNPTTTHTRGLSLQDLDMDNDNRPKPPPKNYKISHNRMKSS